MTSPTMTSPTMPMQTLITWRDAKSARPPAGGWYTVLRMRATERWEDGVPTRAYWDGSYWSSESGDAILQEYVLAWVSPSDIQHGEFVSVERVRGLPSYRPLLNGVAFMGMRQYGDIPKVGDGWAERDQRFVRLSDIEQLGKGG